MKFNLFHHSGDAAPHPTRNEHKKVPAQDEPSELNEGGRTLVTMSNKPADSDVIIAKVDAAYKEFTSFQKNLKQLLRLYKEEHAAMKNINEKRFEAAKTLDVMFATSPLSSAVARGKSPAPAPREIFSDSLLNMIGQDEEINATREVGSRDKSGDNYPYDEEKGDDPDAPHVEDQSLSLQTVGPSLDPPADVEIPDEYPTYESISERLARDRIAKDTDTLDVIVDNDDDMLSGDTMKHSRPSINPDLVKEPSGDKEVSASVSDYCAERTESKTIHDPTGEKEEVPPSETYCESNGPKSKVNEEPTGEKVLNVKESISFAESTGPMLREGGHDVTEESNEVQPEKEDEHEIAVEDEHHEAEPVGEEPESYYDVQEFAYMELKKLIEQHGQLVKYVEEWEHILFQRVNGLYTEYMKQRKSLQHYIKKLGQLRREMTRLQKISEEKEKLVNPSKIEKLERNEVKLVGSREAHDKSGESLHLFLDEVVNRAWRDVYPLIQRTAKFDKDFSEMQAKIFTRLNGTIELLDLVGRNEAVSMTSRLKSLQTLNPEVIYTGDAQKSL